MKDLFSKGVKAIPHGATKEKYKLLLSLSLKWNGVVAVALHDDCDIELPSEGEPDADVAPAEGEAIGHDLDI